MTRPLRFLLNGSPVSLAEAPAQRTLLDWLREERRLTGTKEGCNEGDCGACTVMISDPQPEGGHRWQVRNACILLLPMLHGRAVRTVEGLGEGGAFHPVQEELVRHHGSQCGFCTPGIAVALAAAHADGRRDFDTALAGNLCRCTGYASIIRAAEAAAEAPAPGWVKEDLARLDDLAAPGPLTGPGWIAHDDVDAFAAWYRDHPEARLVAGATDVGLWVTKKLMDITPVAFLHRLKRLKRVEVTTTHITFGALAPIEALRVRLAEDAPQLGAFLSRFGSEQVRAAGTVGGNIANASPIGDSLPLLIALGATLRLRRSETRREMPLEDFFLDYGVQDRKSGEFVEAVTLPRPRAAEGRLVRAWKISKRRDQDISAVAGAFDFVIANGTVSTARIAFGGMAATPRRARATEAALVGRPWTEATIRAAGEALAEDFTPISDMRASARYRMEAARGLLERLWHESRGTGPIEIDRVLEEAAR